jgi:hypothetical protein
LSPLPSTVEAQNHLLRLELGLFTAKSVATSISQLFNDFCRITEFGLPVMLYIAEEAFNFTRRSNLACFYSPPLRRKLKKNLSAMENQRSSSLVSSENQEANNQPNSWPDHQNEDKTPELNPNDEEQEDEESPMDYAAGSDGGSAGDGGAA